MFKQLNKGGEKMSTEEKKIVASLAEAVKALPEEKRDYLRGYAEGVAAMAERANEAAAKNAAPQAEDGGNMERG